METYKSIHLINGSPCLRTPGLGGLKEGLNKVMDGCLNTQKLHMAQDIPCCQSPAAGRASLQPCPAPALCCQLLERRALVLTLLEKHCFGGFFPLGEAQNHKSP